MNVFSSTTARLRDQYAFANSRFTEDRDDSPAAGFNLTECGFDSIQLQVAADKVRVQTLDAAP